MICKQCSNEFEPLRASAQFCTPKCRLAFHRGVSVSDDMTAAVTARPAKDIKVRLEEIRLKYKLAEITPALLSKETGLSYSFVPAWLANGLSLSDIESLAS
jgi:hypothetical protein